MIQSDVTRRQLDVINRVPGFSVRDHIAVPQLVVCGNPSVGKSSVLESIAGIPLRSEGATRFPIEISIRHADCERAITASIIPHYTRDHATAAELRRFSRVLSDDSELPEVIEEVTATLQLHGFTGDANASAYASDVLRIKVVGDTGIHLTLVDAPAVISRTDEEVRLVKEVLDTYLEKPTSTILAVIPADRDIENEHTLQLCSRYDPLGQRTIGVVTKPDLIPDEPSALKIAQLLRNKSPGKLELGYFVLQNPGTENLTKRASSLGRSESELSYFQNSFSQKIQSDPSRTGVPALQTFLKSHLEAHFNKELPKVSLKIMQQLQDTRQQYEDMGAGRDSIREQRLYLSELSTNFSQFVHSALRGMYWDIEFFSDAKGGTSNNRLREQIQRLNSSFLNYMLEESHTVKVRRPEPTKKKSNPPPEKPNYTASSASTVSSGNSQTPPNSSHLAPLGEPEMVTMDEFNDWMLKVYRKAKKSSELRGNQTHEILPEVFRAQSIRWRAIGEHHTKSAHKMVSDFVYRVLECVVKEDEVRTEIQRFVVAGLRQNLSAALEELGKILDDDKVQPTTYEFHVSEHTRRVKEVGMKGIFKKAFNPGGETYDPSSEDRARAVASLQPEFQAEWDDRVASGGMAAALYDYYTAATNTFVDNVCRQAIERHIVQKLGNVFNISTVLNLSDEEVQRIASEPLPRKQRKSNLTEYESVLSNALDDLHTS